MPGAVRTNIMIASSEAVVTIVDPSALMFTVLKRMSGGDTKGVCV